MSGSTDSVSRFWVASIVVGVVILLGGAVLAPSNATFGWVLIVVGVVATIGAIIQLLMGRRSTR